MYEEHVPPSVPGNVANTCLKGRLWVSDLDYEQHSMLRIAFNSDKDSDMSEIQWPRLSCNLWAVRLHRLTLFSSVGIHKLPILVLQGNVNVDDMV